MPPGPDPAALFHSLADPSRLRLLRLLRERELNVQELVRITGLAQSRVSRQLAVLRKQGWLDQRREGTFSWYRAVGPSEFPFGADLFHQIVRAAGRVPEAGRDDDRLAAALAERRRRSDDFFAGLAERWDSIRDEYEHPDIRLGVLAGLVDPRLRVLDIGTGTGAMLPVLAAAAGRVVALDNSVAMLDRARALCREEGLGSVSFCRGEVAVLPFASATFDACHCAMTLHHVADPAAAVVEMARVVVPGGSVTVTAFCRHEETWMRDELGHAWLGFERDEIEGMFVAAGLAPGRWVERSRRVGDHQQARPPAGGRPPAWPDVFLAIGTGANRKGRPEQ